MGEMDKMINSITYHVKDCENQNDNLCLLGHTVINKTKECVSYKYKREKYKWSRTT